MSTFRDAGDGDRCPQDPEHGHMYFVGGTKQKQWCPSSRHTGDALYRHDGVTPLRPAAVPLPSPAPSR